MSVEFRIMGVRKRREQFILPMLESLKMNEDIVFYDDEYNYEKKNINALRCCKRTFLAPTDKTHICVMQDDLELCDNFVEIVEECAKRFPNAIFSFYQPRLKPEEKCNETPYVKIKGSGMYGQCIMIPSYMVKVVFAWSDANYGEDYIHSDTVIGFFCEVNGIPVMATHPCIVQHLGCSDSAMGYNNKNKVSKIYDKHPDIAQFKTKKFVVSKYIPNTPIPPEGGYKCGSLRKLKDLL